MLRVSGKNMAPVNGTSARPRGTRRERLPIALKLAAAFAAIAIVFTGGLLASHRLIVQIGAAAKEITGNTSPSISLLSEMRSTLRQLQVATGEHLRACQGVPCVPSAEQLGRIQERLRQTWHRYRLLPTSPGEEAQWPRVDTDLDRVSDALAVTIEASRAGRLQEADSRFHEQLTPAFDWLDDGIARIKDHEHRAGTAAAARIAYLANLTTLAFAGVAAFSVVLTVLAAALAIRVVRRYERSLRDRADDLEQFAGRVAHDLKGPLTSTAAALQQAGRLSSGHTREAIDRGQRGLHRVRRLVDDLLDFARAGASDPRGGAADVQDVVDEVVGDLSEVAAENRVELRVESLARERVACSRGVLASVVQNLLKNAITHMGESELRVVRVRATPAPDGRRIRIEVEDSGPGIPESLGETVFEPFVRGPCAPPTGTGIGLATVKRFVSAHGGRIGFRPTTRRGTLFWLEMPRGAGRSGPARA
jgi:signal transduction histidine kinase